MYIYIHIFLYCSMSFAQKHTPPFSEKIVICWNNLWSSFSKMYIILASFYILIAHAWYAYCHCNTIAKYTFWNKMISCTTKPYNRLIHAQDGFLQTTREELQHNFQFSCCAIGNCPLPFGNRGYCVETYVRYHASKVFSTSIGNFVNMFPAAKQRATDFQETHVTRTCL